MFKKLFCLLLSLFLTCCIHAFTDCGCTRAYVGIEGGGVWTIGHGRGNNTGGGAYDGLARKSKMNATGIVGASLGIKFNCLRADISYSYFQTRFKWTAFFPDTAYSLPFLFPSHLKSQLVLANLYLHLNQWFAPCFFCGFEPYFGVGLGAAHNSLSKIREINGVTGALLANVKSQAHTNFAARVGLGVMRTFCRCFAFDLAFFANYIGKISTGNSRVVVTGFFQQIGPYVFKRNWTGSLTLGLKYFF